MKDEKDLKKMMVADSVLGSVEKTVPASEATNSSDMSVGEMPKQKKSTPGQVHYNRKQRRPIMRMINKAQSKGKSTNLNFGEWSKRVRDNQEQGKQLSERYEAIVMKSIEYQMTTIEASIRTRLISEGKTKKEVEAWIEAWYDKTKIWKDEVQ